MRPDLGLPRYSRAVRLMIATGIAGVLSVPVFLYLQGNEIFTTRVREFLTALLQITNGAIPSASPDTLSRPGQPLQPEVLMQAVTAVMLRSFLFYYFLVLTFSWWLGTRIGARSIGSRPALTRIADFKLPDRFVWPLIASLALVLMTLLVRVRILEIVAWNTLLILLFLYGVAGLGIIRYLLRKRKVNRRAVWIGIAAFIFVAMIPRVGIGFLSLLLILIPGLGVSEVWLKYRTEERSNA
jgi:hypothetical protein